ncbi:PREDICTED: uncharacterized protein LOC106125649 [Papilio xuthus]|uniref:Uncharacterized protein LOC106125649 n=1 Tax=Papilio xuthus TaxID=66420 RepID=A0AAJ6ZST2_PAPXU|nr:PREDICTED: uncharacterized protein LOC106125649 [Papilio xuthus]
MQLHSAFALSLLLIAKTEDSDEIDRLIITNDIYPEQYTDQDDFGRIIEKGLYVFKDGIAVKLLDNGRDVAAAADESNVAFIAAGDGIYLYNDERVSVHKYGNISDSIIGIAKPTHSDIIYILTEDKEVYIVNGLDDKKEKVNDIINAEQIILDNENNLYYLDSDTQVYFYDFLSVTKIEGLPDYAFSARLLKPPITTQDFVPFFVDGQLYCINTKGYAELFDKVEFAGNGTPSAYAMEDGVVHYYAINKKIYEFDIYDILHNGAKGLLGKLVKKTVADEILTLIGLLV